MSKTLNSKIFWSLFVKFFFFLWKEYEKNNFFKDFQYLKGFLSTKILLWEILFMKILSLWILQSVFLVMKKNISSLFKKNCGALFASKWKFPKGKIGQKIFSHLNSKWINNIKNWFEEDFDWFRTPLGLNRSLLFYIAQRTIFELKKSQEAIPTSSSSLNGIRKNSFWRDFLAKKFLRKIFILQAVLKFRAFLLKREYKFTLNFVGK